MPTNGCAVPQLYLRVVSVACMMQVIASKQFKATNPREEKSSDDTLPPYFQKLQTVRIDSDPSVNWLQFGPGMSGNNYRTYWHPTDPDWNYEGPNMGNSYYSSNRGTTYWGSLDYDAPQNYTEMGPIDMKAVAFSYQDENFGFCSSDKSQGMWMTIDKGRSWKYCYDLDAVWQGSHINYIQADPTNDSIWYAGAGDAYDFNHFIYTHENQHGSAGSVNGDEIWVVDEADVPTSFIWRSMDKGQSWKPVGQSTIPKDANIVRIVVHPRQPNKVFAATTYGLFKSSDHGDTWALCHVDNDIVRDMDVRLDKESGVLELYVITITVWDSDGAGGIKVSSGGLYMSANEGETWKSLVGDMDVNMSVLAEDYTIRTSYYRMLGLWFGVNQVDAAKLYPNISSHFMYGIVRVRVDPNNNSYIYVMNDYKAQVTCKGVVMWCTADGGAHWDSCWRGGTVWNNSSGTAVEYWKGRGNPLGVNVHLAYLEHMWIENADDYFRKSGNVLDFNADGSFLMTQIAKVVTNSTDHGASWHSSQEQETSPGSNHWVGAGNSNTPCEELMQDTRFPNTLFMCAGENWLWSTTSDGDLVRPNAQAGTARYMPAEASVSSVAIDPNDTRTFYTLHFRQWMAGYLARSTDDGKTFAPIGHPVQFPKGVHNPTITQNSLQFHPADSNFMVFCIPAIRVEYHIHQSIDFSDFGVYVSSNRGVNWTRQNTGLPANLNVNRLLFNPHNDSEFYAAVSFLDSQNQTHNQTGGLFISIDRAQSWERVDIPHGIDGVNDVKIDQDGNMFIATGYSYGEASAGGVWRRTAGQTSWVKIFYMPFVIDVEIAKYDVNTLLVATNPSHTVQFLNPGVYVSHDSGATWKKVNKYLWQPGQIRDCAIDQVKKGVYYCATYGSGWFRGLEST